MSPREIVLCPSLVSLLLFSSCAMGNSQVRNNALTYLYPKGTQAVPASDVQLNLPVRVGVAFPPEAQGFNTSFSEAQKVTLLTRLANSFRGREGIGSVQVIPASFFSNGGGFDELDRIAPAFGIDLIALVSYDQFQFTESSRWNFAYLTIVGAYVIEGERNETRTLMDAIVYDIHSRAMLLNATGQSNVKADAAPVDLERVLREGREAGFDQAMSDVITHLDTAVGEFQKQVATGTVRGAGTPKIEMHDPASGQSRTAGGGGAGALALPELAWAVLLCVLGFVGRRDR